VKTNKKLLQFIGYADGISRGWGMGGICDEKIAKLI
jgi:hypothetical protein